MKKIAFCICLTLFAGFSLAQDTATAAPQEKANPAAGPAAEVVEATDQDAWHNVKSSDGVIEAMLPGKATKKLDKRRTLAGTITTKALEFHTDEVEFTVTSTRLPKLLRKMADDNRLYETAKEKVLFRAYGKEKSFKETTIDGFAARELRYEVVHFEDESHNGYDGVAIFLVRNNKVYAANAIMAKEAGNADLDKFRKSIRIKKKIDSSKQK